MEDPKDKLQSILEKVAAELGVEASNFSVEKPKDSLHGDFSTNIAMVLHQTIMDEQSGLNSPLALAEKIVVILNTKYKMLDTDFDKVEVAAPGFINFYLSKKYLQSQVQSIIEKGDEYGSSLLGKGKKASVEFVSANPTGPLHIGNARGGPLGDAIANVLAKAGYQITREYLHNDVGGQVERLGESIYFEIHPDQKPESYEVQYLGSYIKELAQTVKEQLEEGQEDLSQEQFIERAGRVAVELMLAEILKDCEAMGIKFDKVRKESDLRKEVPQVLLKIKKALKEKDGAVWFAPADEFLKDRETVVKKSDGQFTYFASDIVYHDEKMAQNDLVIDVLGANHSGHVPRLKAVVKALGFNPDDLRVTLYQWVRLKRGEEVVKMSKRAGNFVTAKEVLDEVGKDAFRFFLLTPKSSTHMDFDLELAKKRASDNPVFYVQYAHSRICSIFKKSQQSEASSQKSVDLSLLKTEEEISLIRHLLKLPYLVEEAANALEVNPLTTYVLEIANLFHKFYETQMVISKDEKLTQSRLALLKATQITLKNTLSLLGVSAPEHM
ncbi:MAG TPA: arginine--tRNA ligase [Patescibacteria group bacterium]|jgi:arginyl-tRNA synthetase|nr:arginine--tRNA ligase [Patescibacteria group bacterium]